ncbi:MAG: transposase [Candidatus Atribacteria bacterium]|nr:transposase [Candidatus Atribacteria bacterium]
MNQEKRQKYDKEFKLEILRLVNEQKRTIAQVARDFGIGKNTIYKWKQALILTKYHFPPSMSGKENCYDKA